MTKGIKMILAVLPILCLGQITDEQKVRIDSLFQKWDLENYPGGVVGVIQSDTISYLNAFGNASLEYDVPNTSKTMFNIGSVSKQFTAMGIVVLHQQGLLSIDERVEKYFPDFPIFQNPITLKHLLQHTSGLRDFHELLALAGWRGDDYRTDQDILKFMKKQSDLNFHPGERFMYSNTGYVLLAKIIEKVTHEDFGKWMKNNIFDPLGLHSTYVEENYQRIVPQNATSYYHSHDKIFEMAQGYWAYTGAGNVHSTARDLLIWSKNYYSPKNGWEASFQMLQTLGEFNDGGTSDYAFGIYIDELFGTKRIQHAGVVGGYRAFLCTYPKKALSVVVLTNFSNAPFGEMADDVVGILLTKPRQKAQNRLSSNHTKKQGISYRCPLDLTEYSGTFYSTEIDTWYTFYVEGNTLKCSHARHGEFIMECVAQDEFRGSWPLGTIKMSRNPKGEVDGLYISTGRVKNLWFKKIKSSIN